MPTIPHQNEVISDTGTASSANEHKPVDTSVFDEVSTSMSDGSDAYQNAPPKPRRMPTPGPALSYEEAKARLFQNFDEALHELAK